MLRRKETGSIVYIQFEGGGRYLQLGFFRENGTERPEWLTRHEIPREDLFDLAYRVSEDELTDVERAALLPEESPPWP